MMKRHGVVNRMVPEAELVQEATALATKMSTTATRAHAAHKTLRWVWATGGVAAADEAMFHFALPLFESEDAELATSASASDYKAGRPRPLFAFRGW